MGICLESDHPHMTLGDSCDVQVGKGSAHLRKPYQPTQGGELKWETHGPSFMWMSTPYCYKVPRISPMASPLFTSEETKAKKRRYFPDYRASLHAAEFSIESRLFL